MCEEEFVQLNFQFHDNGWSTKMNFIKRQKEEREREKVREKER